MNRKVLLTAINAKYIHSNLAVYSLKAYAGCYGEQIEVAEFTINQQTDYILQEIYRKKPDILAFSCYVWNMEHIGELLENISVILPETIVWLGGPEVSSDSEEVLKKYPGVKGIMQWEGEDTFLRLMQFYLGRQGMLQEIPGIVFREKEQIIRGIPGDREYLSMDEIPFVYEDLSIFENKIIYYESSRGCPFSCSYCLSSIDKRVRFRSFSLVQKELQYFLDHRVPQVKFVDRTFNCSHSHAMQIWQYILEHDNGLTNFHFEIEADLLTEEELELLGCMRPGLVQLEIGVQSTNPLTLEAVHRRTDFARISAASERIASARNIHQHLDLIAGLPYEDMESFRRSFDDVYRLRPQELQLGFLKVLHGSAMEADAERYGIRYHSRPVYEVLSTEWLSYEDILKLKAVEEMLEVYYNSGQFAVTIRALEQEFSSAFSLYEALADFYEENTQKGNSFSRMQRLELLRSFALALVPSKRSWYEECLLMDLYLRENARSRPEWATDLSIRKEDWIEFYRMEERQRRYLPGYEAYNWKQMGNMTHLEHFAMKNGRACEHWVLFDYSSRDPLTYNARTVEIVMSGRGHRQEPQPYAD